MSFTQSTFAPIGSPSTDAPAIFSYRTADSNATIVADNYFIDKKHQLEAGDVIVGDTSDGFRIYTVQSDTSTVIQSEELPNNTIVINAASEFDDAVGGEIPTIAGKTYFIGADVTVTDPIRVETGVAFISNNFFGPTLTSTSVNGLFKGGDGSFRVNNLDYAAPNGKLFDFTDTVPGTSNIIVDGFNCTSYKEIATFTDVGGFNFSNGVFFDPVNSTDGITVSGATIFGAGIRDVTMITTDATFIGLDMGTTEAGIFNLSDFNVNGVSGTIGLKGTTASGNVIAGGIANVSNCAMNGGGATPISVITTDDIRWNFQGNAGLSNSMPDAMVSMTGNATETVIAIQSTPVKVAGTFVSERASQFTADTTGKITYNGERDLTTPVDITITFEAASGSNKDVAVYLALNGSVIANSKRTAKVSANDPRSPGVIWQLVMTTTDFLEIYVENNTDIFNIIVIDATLRVR